MSAIPFSAAPTGMQYAALWYAEQGIPVFPLHSVRAGKCTCGNAECSNEGKHPRWEQGTLEHGLLDATTSHEQIQKWWGKWPAANIGIPMGAASLLLAVDIDPRHGGTAAWDAIVYKNGTVPDTAEQITGSGGRHIVFRCPDTLSVPSRTIVEGVDIKCDGGYIVAAPSLHLSGNRYQWDGIRGKDALIDVAEPPPWLLSLVRATDADEPKGDPAPDAEWGPGDRYNNLFSVAGKLRRVGMSQSVIEASLIEANRKHCKPPKADADVKKIAKGIMRYPPAALPNVDPKKDKSQPSNGCEAEWQKPEPIQSELPPVKAFLEDLLPDSFRPLVEDVAERMQVPIDFPAVVSVLCLAGAVNRRARIQPKRSDSGWIVVPNLWGAIVAPPGYMKTPVIQAVTSPLTQIQNRWREEYENELTNYERAKEEHELRRAAWKEQYKQTWKDQHKPASKEGKWAPPARPEDEPNKPTERRLIANDATSEALHETMRDNPAGILFIRDELTGWLAQLDRPGREGERAFHLEAWNGDTGHTMDRIGRGSIHVSGCCTSMLGGIQPARLRSYLADAIEDGPGNDGLVQRFQLFVWPDAPEKWEYIDRSPNAAAEEKAASVFRRLVAMDAENPALFRFDPDAQQLFEEWLSKLESKIRGDQFHPALISHLSKYRSLMPSLALLFELADARGECESNTVSLRHAEQAAAWCAYLESHAPRIYSCIVTPQLRAARELADKIKHRKLGAEENKEKGKEKGFFFCRDVYLKGWSGLDSPEAVKRAAEVLEDAGWIRDVSPEPGPLGGRPSNRYQVNPRIWEVRE